MFQSTSTLTRVWFAALLALAGAASAYAQPAGSRADDEAAVRQAGRTYRDAVERGDDKASAEFWTAGGTYLDEAGSTAKVRELPTKTGGPLNNAAIRTTDPDAKIRFVTADVAIEEGEVVSPAVDGDAPEKSRYVAIWVREDGKWKLDNVCQTHVAPTSNDSQLRSLDILAGDWSGASNGITIRVAAKWDANQKFLRREISMDAGKASLVGRQFIGWDPLTQQIRSWLFSDDGSYTDGFWSMEGNFWMVRASRVLPDGAVSTATHVYTFPDRDTLVWKVIDGSIGGLPTDDLQVVLKRTAAR